MFYEIYTIGNEMIGSFESNWQYREGEILFIQTGTKRAFTVKHITHDVFLNEKHIVRLYCQEKRTHS